MAGTHNGAIKAVKTSRLRHGVDHFRKAGAAGGAAGHGAKGFAVMSREKVSAAGHKGGTKSAAKRWRKFPYEPSVHKVYPVRNFLGESWPTIVGVVWLVILIILAWSRP